MTVRYPLDVALKLTTRRVWQGVARAIVEIAFIIFLFYSNLLMGEFTVGSGAGKSLAMALHDVVTEKNFAIALGSAALGFLFFEYLRKRL
jgi:hypothetical protein